MRPSCFDSGENCARSREKMGRRAVTRRSQRIIVTEMRPKNQVSYFIDVLTDACFTCPRITCPRFNWEETNQQVVRLLSLRGTTPLHLPLDSGAVSSLSYLQKRAKQRLSRSALCFGTKCSTRPRLTIRWSRGVLTRVERHRACE